MTGGRIHLESLDRKILHWILQQAADAEDTQANLHLSGAFSNETNEETIAKWKGPLRLTFLNQTSGFNAYHFYFLF